MPSGSDPVRRRRPDARGLTFLALLLAATLAAGGCATAPERPFPAQTGDPIVDGNAQLAAGRPQDRVLWDYRIAAAALRLGQQAEARAKLDDAILRMGGLIANSAEAKKARSLFSHEDRKVYIGEPYERVMAYYYRGILYWADGQPDNARACFRTGEFIDSDAEAAEYKGDYVLLDYLDGLASEKLGGSGADALKRAQASARGRTLPPYDPAKNVLVFAEYGRGPRKYQGGEYGEQLRFMTADSPARSATLTVNGQTVPLPAYDDLNYQATTRGGRVMDHILGNKAVFKTTTDTIGNVALLGSVVAASNMYRGDGTKSHNTENAAIALGAIGLIGKLASAATTPQADIRTWENLPQRLSFAAVQLPPGSYPARVEYFDAAGQRIAALTQELTIQVDDPARDTVVFISELKR